MFTLFGLTYPDAFHLLPGVVIGRLACPCCGRVAWRVELYWGNLAAGVTWHPDNMEGGRGA